MITIGKVRIPSYFRANFKIKSNDLAVRKIRNTAGNIIDELRASTPIKTGRARGGWDYHLIKNGFRVYNNVPYIRKLNDGSSRQAPRNFIEHVLLKYKNKNTRHH